VASGAAAAYVVDAPMSCIGTDDCFRAGNNRARDDAEDDDDGVGNLTVAPVTRFKPRKAEIRNIVSHCYLPTMSFVRKSLLSVGAPRRPRPVAV